MKKLCVSLLALCVAILPMRALAWGDEGHKIVAAIAWHYLTPKARMKIQALLDRDTDTLTLPDFASRATWADKYRDSDRDAQGPAYLGTRNWHFINIPVAKVTSVAAAETSEPAVCPHPALAPGQAASAGAPADSCVIDKIRQFEAELANPATSVKEQIYALKFLEHFIGDVHQPFHAADADDHGGNCIWLVEGPYGLQNLHAYWDTGVVIEMTDRIPADDFAKVLTAQITPVQKAAWEKDDPALWAAESAQKAAKIGYDLHQAPLPTCAADNKTMPIRPPAGYETTARAVAKEQLEKAGVRLAFVLNRITG